MSASPLPSGSPETRGLVKKRCDDLGASGASIAPRWRRLRLEDAHGRDDQVGDERQRQERHERGMTEMESHPDVLLSVKTALRVSCQCEESEQLPEPPPLTVALPALFAQDPVRR